MDIIFGLIAMFTVCHFDGLVLKIKDLFRLQVNFVMMLMQKLKIHQLYKFLSHNLKNALNAYKHFNFGKKMLFYVNYRIKLYLVILILIYIYWMIV